MSETTQALEIPEDVREYARERGLEPYLEPLLAAARRHFPECTPRMVVEDDPEVDDLRHLVILIRADSLDVRQYLASNAAYKREKFEILPSGLRTEVRLGKGDPDDPPG